MKTALLLFAVVASLRCYAEDRAPAEFSLTKVMWRLDTTLLLSKDDPVPQQAKFAYNAHLSAVHTNIIMEGMEIDRGRVIRVDKRNRIVELDYDGKRQVVRGFAEGVVTNFLIVVSTSGHQNRMLRIGQALDVGWILASVAPTSATFTNKAGQSLTLRLSE